MAALPQVLLEEDRDGGPCPSCTQPVKWHVVIDLGLTATLRGVHGPNVEVDVESSPVVAGVAIDHHCGLLVEVPVARRRRCMCEHNEQMHQVEAGPCHVDHCDCAGFIERNT